MKRIIEQRNGTGIMSGIQVTTDVIEENPHLQDRPDPEDQVQVSAGMSPLVLSIDDDDGSPAELVDKHRKAKQHRRRFAVAGLALLLVGLVGAVAVSYRTATRVDYGTAAKQREVLPPPPNVNPTPGRDSRTEHAIEEAQRLTAGKAQIGSKPSDSSIGASEMTSYSGQSEEIPFKVPTGLRETLDPTLERTNTGTNTEGTLGIERGSSSIPANDPSGTVPTTIRSQRSSETSLYIANATSESGVTFTDRKTTNAVIHKSKADAVVSPSFASMLPVRTVGALYTLRTGALVRLELTRETKGNGWSMKRGTILVGTSKGSDYDRAYVSMIGFIDPETGKLVKLGGDVQGGDGGVGLKGKRRQVDSGWARALGLLSSAAVELTGAFLSGRGGETVVISDGLRTRAINPVTNEISGVLGTQLERGQSRAFVEVAAGTPGYVMVTDLPGVIRGVDATPEVNSKSLASLTDVESARPATGLSEREFADLLASGSPEEIRAAFSRMSPEMRKIASAVSNQ